MTSDIDLLRAASERAVTYAAGVDGRATAPTAASVQALARFDEPLPVNGCDPAETLELLDHIGGPATMATTGSNYYGFVNGATYPVALGASFLVNAWDQNAALPVMSAVASKLHEISRTWLIDLLGMSATTDVAYVTGATVANATCIAAARDALLIEAGWDCQRDGLFDAPSIQVVIGQNAHSTLRKSLGFTGLGRERVTIVPADDQGRILADELPDLDPADGPILICAQAGEVNTGAYDPFSAICDWAADRSAWVHVDAAFGLWALADPTRAHLVEGLLRADSLATDGHKWLNVTYDCGIAFVQREHALRRSFNAMAGYLPAGDAFEAMHHTPQSSQRARQIEVWAVLRTLGRDGVARMVQQASACAVAIADELRAHDGFTIVNDVVINQVLLRFRDPVTTTRLIAAIQADGRIWCGPTMWHGEAAMRISVSSWKTDLEDAAFAARVIIECSRSL